MFPRQALRVTLDGVVFPEARWISELRELGHAGHATLILILLRWRCDSRVPRCEAPAYHSAVPAPVETIGLAGG